MKAFIIWSVTKLSLSDVTLCVLRAPYDDCRWVALIDRILCQIPGADFKMVTSYVLGEKPEVNKPTPGYTLLNFEVRGRLLRHCAHKCLVFSALC